MDYVDISIVVPVYNEEQVIKLFIERVVPILSGTGLTYEIIFVNDGSKDQTFSQIANERALNPSIKALDLSRNFGKEAALSAGLDFAIGRAVIPMDVDCQDPPELIPTMIDNWQQGFEVVLAKRIDRGTDSRSKRISSNLFYNFIGRLTDVPIPKNVGDFRLMDRKVVEALSRLPERTRFNKGIFAWLGFRQTEVTYARPIRVAGTTKWKPLALVGLALDGIVSFSNVPLKLAIYVGILCAGVGLGYGAFILLRTIIYGVDLPGYASIVTIMMFFNGIVLLGMGIMGEYIGRIFIEVKARPIYLVRETLS